MAEETTTTAAQASEIDNKINDLKAQAETADGGKLAEIQAEIAKLSSKKDEIMADVSAVQKDAGAVEDAINKGKDMLGGLHL